MNFNWIIFSVVSVIINLVAYFVFPVYSAEITTSTGQKILKMRGTRHTKKIVPFRFERGIKIFPNEEVF